MGRSSGCIESLSSLVLSVTEMGGPPPMLMHNPALKPAEAMVEGADLNAKDPSPMGTGVGSCIFDGIRSKSEPLFYHPCLHRQ